MIGGTVFFIVLTGAALYLEKIDAKTAACYAIALIASMALAWRANGGLLLIALPFLCTAVLAIHAGLAHERVR